MNAARITQLATIISTQTSLISDYLCANDISQPSFEPNAPIDVVPACLESARSAVLDAAGLAAWTCGPHISSRGTPDMNIHWGLSCVTA
jgi:hypothetical protein